MLTASDARRRWRGLFCLAVAAGLLVWGQIVLQPVLQGVWFLLYWMACFLFTVAAIVIALLDLRATRRRIREEHRQLLQRTLTELEARARSGSPPAEPGRSGEPEAKP